ncbi:MAG: hypothetical protein AAAB16_24235, partial [Pseudomonas sp.]
GSCAWMAFGLFVLGAWLENRDYALGLEVLRLLLNAPALWVAEQVGLLPINLLSWSLLGIYSLLSALALLMLARRGRSGVPA